MGPMRGITCVKSNHSFPFALREYIPCFLRSKFILRKLQNGPLNHCNPSAKIYRWKRIGMGNAWMFWVKSIKNILALPFLVWGILFLKFKRGKKAVGAISKSYFITSAK